MGTHVGAVQEITNCRCNKIYCVEKNRTLGWLAEQGMLSTQDLLQLGLNLRRGRILHCLLLLRLPWRWLEILSQVVIEAALVARDLNGQKLDLDGDAGVLFAVVAAAVQAKEAAKAVVFQVFPALTGKLQIVKRMILRFQALPEFTPLCLRFRRFDVIL